MKPRIRRPAILFAIFSAIYWMLVSDLIGVTRPLGGFGAQSYWKVALAGMIPGAVYAAATLYFCHWLVRRAVRQMTKKAGE